MEASLNLQIFTFLRRALSTTPVGKLSTFTQRYIHSLYVSNWIWDEVLGTRIPTTDLLQRIVSYHVSRDTRRSL